MLHELLLALSGHPSPLFSSNDEGDQTLPLSPSERALVRKLATLGNIQTKVRTEATTIASNHYSVICRAMAAAIIDTHLARFLSRVVEVERGTLQKDASYVGAYDVVPLSTIVYAFESWERPLVWLAKSVAFIEDGTKTGAKVIDWLRDEVKTGYPDIEKIATQLVQVAESTWLQQASAWTLYGSLPTVGQKDFFVQAIEREPRGRQSYRIVKELMPRFVSPETAQTVLEIGRSIHYINDQASGSIGFRSSRDVNLIQYQISILSALAHPFTALSLDNALRTIRSKVSQRALTRLLPAAKIKPILSILHSFFLLKRMDFDRALVDSADEWSMGNRARVSRRPRQAGAAALPSAKARLGELSSILSGAWAHLMAAQDFEEDPDDELEAAQDMLHLREDPQAQEESLFEESTGGLIIPEKNQKLFSSPLLPSATMLVITVPPPMDIFLSVPVQRAYSIIHNYLLSIRAQHLRLSRLWQLTTLRRLFSQLGNFSRKQDEAWLNADRSIHGVWSTISSARFLMGETLAYFQDEVIAKFDAGHGIGEVDQDSSEYAPDSTANDFARTGAQRADDKDRYRQNEFDEHSPGDDTLYDPEALISSHNTQLKNLQHALLLTDQVFPTELQSLLTQSDHLAALVRRLAEVRQINRALSDPTAEGSDVMGVGSEEAELRKPLAQARHNVDQALKRVNQRLKDIDRDGLIVDAAEGEGSPDSEQSQAAIAGGDGKGLERLLARLDLDRYDD